MSVPLQFAEDLWVRGAFSAAGHTVLVFDYFLTINDEVLYIWNAPWSFVKVMFLVNRYGNLLGQTFIRVEEAGLLTHNSQSFCRYFTLITAIHMLMCTESIHILVLSRAWAIWGTGRRTTKILIWSYMIYFVIQLAGALLATKGGNIAHFRHLRYAQVCVGALPKYAWLTYFGSFILDTLLFFLTMRSLRKYSTEFRYLYPSGLLHLLVRDAFIFFIVGLEN
ncbi:hypothetical protein K503DRAFT_320847 [Rhizopogon vinicolor AM-OR11-026]|uniref:DUF6533 domain-containing protein n=1 Tax=Rhizopogon vinicolor AM-OR11-026 TaxID=1314800 RepID=A0A1B7MUE7_9AGAM|nr:hypothetical protein K503DRAFT_320847 [Rhizopogon vinicolor AM-OR11-026]